MAAFCYSIARLFDAELLRQRHLAALVFWTHELQQSLGRPGAFLFCYHLARCIILDASIALRRRCLLSRALLLLVEGAASVFLLHDLRLTIDSCSPPAARRPVNLAAIFVVYGATEQVGRRRRRLLHACRLTHC